MSGAAPGTRSIAEVRHEVLLASAGSGKTWRLATRFLRLAALGADPATILASSFTRAASGEIRDRIIERVAEAALDTGATARLSIDLGVDLGPHGRGIDALLARIVGAWPRLQVRTLDSLMFAIVSAHALELGIDPGTALADDVQVRAMHREATRRLLDRIGEERAVALLKELTAGRSDSDVARAIDSVVTRLHDLWREAPQKAWEAVRGDATGPSGPSGSFGAAGAAGAPRRDDELHAAIERMRRCPGVGNKSFEKGVAAFIALANAGRWEELFAKGLGLKLAEGAMHYHAKPIPDELIVCGGLVVDHARVMVCEGILRQTLAARDLVAGWSAFLDEIKRERRLVGFDDLPWLLRRAEAVGSLDTIAYRLDARLHHMLLDEMQDTSAPQWAALRPFAAELYSQRAGERSFFCVGDLKQSIYGWRGASPEILASLPATIGIEPTTLALTRRCGPTVVATVNRVFGDLPALACLEEVAGAARGFSAFFTPHETSRAEIGYAQLRCAPTADHDEDDETGMSAVHDMHVSQASLRLRAAAEMVTRLHRSAPRATIGVLVRTNAVVNRMLFLLGPGGAALPVAGRGGAPLTDTPAVEAILDLLRLAVHPGHTAAGFNVACSPLGPVVGLARGDGPGAPPDAASRSRTARSVRERVARDGLATTVGAWVAALASSADARERRRLVQLAELAAQAPTGDTGESASPIMDFVARIETTNVAHEADAPIQVMTVHQSKGLEFDLVVLPELETPLVRTQGQVAAWDRETPGGPPTAIIRWIDEKRRVALPAPLAAIFDRHRDRLALESFCLLYVALTRARDGLYAIVDPPRSGRSDKTAAGVLRSALGSCDEVAGEVLFEEGDEAAMLRRLALIGGPESDAASSASPASPALSASTAPIILRPPHGIPRIGAVSPSAASASESARGGDGGATAPLRVDPCRRRDAIDRGTALHAMLERCEWIETFNDDDATLVAAVRRAVSHRDQAWAAAQVAALRPRLSRGVLADLLRRGARVDSEALREHRFARLTSDGLQVGSIDRLVTARRGGRVVTAEIVDFKTGGANASGGEEGIDDREPSPAILAERHRPQVAAYRAAVAEQFELAPEAISARLVFVDLDMVVDVLGA